MRYTLEKLILKLIFPPPPPPPPPSHVLNMHVHDHGTSFEIILSLHSDFRNVGGSSLKTCAGAFPDRWALHSCQTVLLLRCGRIFDPRASLMMKLGMAGTITFLMIQSKYFVLKRFCSRGWLDLCEIISQESWKQVSEL